MVWFLPTQKLFRPSPHLKNLKPSDRPRKMVHPGNVHVAARAFSIREGDNFLDERGKRPSAMLNRISNLTLLSLLFSEAMRTVRASASAVRHTGRSVRT